MSFEIINDGIKFPFFMALYGPGGVGKTGLSTYSESPFFIPTERRTQSFKRDGYKYRGFKDIPSSINEFFEMLRFVIKNHDELGLRTLVIDNLTELQPMIYRDIIEKTPTISRKDGAVKKVESISDYDFGAGYDKAMDYWNRLIAGCDILLHKGINVIVVAHSHSKNDEDINTGEAFKRVDMNLQSWGNSKVPEIFYQKCDYVYYLESEAASKLVKGQFGGQKRIARSSISDVIVYTRRTSRFFAKTTGGNDKIPDFYEYDANSVNETSTKIFEDIEQ